MDHRVGVVEYLSLTKRHAEKFVIRTVDAVVPRCEGDPLEEVLGRWGEVGLDQGVDVTNESPEAQSDHPPW